MPGLPCPRPFGILKNYNSLNSIESQADSYDNNTFVLLPDRMHRWAACADGSGDGLLGSASGVVEFCGDEVGVSRQRVDGRDLYGAGDFGVS